jgi:hypothetical protein
MMWLDALHTQRTDRDSLVVDVALVENVEEMLAVQVDPSKESVV